MKKFIVSTTINPVTEAVEAYDHMPGWHLVMSGDLKTPKDYQLANGTYLSPQDQHRIDPELSDAIGWNSIQRRNFSLLAAYKAGADVIALIDDDNIPLPNWGQNVMVDQEVEVDWYQCDQPCFDPIGATNYPQLWHRGFPLQLLSNRNYLNKTRRRVKVDIQADFWNGDPDIDAICRMEHSPNCEFDHQFFPMAADRISPWNSQNTFISRRVVADYFLFPYCGRMDDIWAGFYAISRGHQVVYSCPSVVQKRNEHDLTVDFLNEIIGYQNSINMIQNLYKDPESIRKYLPGKTIYAWDLFRKHIDKGAQL